MLEMQNAECSMPRAFAFCIQHYFVSLCAVCFLQNLQNLLISNRSVVFFLFLVVA